MGSKDLIAHIGHLLERLDFSEDDDAFTCNIPLDSGAFPDEDVDRAAFIEEIADAMALLGVTVKQLNLIDEEGNEHPLPLPKREWCMHYILDERGRAVPSDDYYAIGRLLTDRKARTVAKTYFTHRGKRVKVSTIFLVINHAFSPGAAPVLWESMIFTKHYRDLDGTQVRYKSGVDAEQGHRCLVAYAKEFLREYCSLRGPRKPTIHQTFTQLRRQRRGEAAQRKRGVRC